MGKVIRLSPVIAAALLIAILIHPGAARPSQAPAAFPTSIILQSWSPASSCQQKRPRTIQSYTDGISSSIRIGARCQVQNKRGMPDPSKRFGESGGPVVWETWKNTSEVYLTTGGTPAPWTMAAALPRQVSQATVSEPDSGDLWQQMTDDAQVDGFNLLDINDQKILYELLMDRDAFGYIRAGTLYNVQGQMRFAATKER